MNLDDIIFKENYIFLFFFDFLSSKTIQISMYV